MTALSLTPCSPLTDMLAHPVWCPFLAQAAMLVFYFSANFVDVYIAKQQRKQLGLCERCGGLNDAATCSQDGCPMRAKAM